MFKIFLKNKRISSCKTAKKQTCFNNWNEENHKQTVE